MELLKGISGGLHMSDAKKGLQVHSKIHTQNRLIPVITLKQWGFWISTPYFSFPNVKGKTKS